MRLRSLSVQDFGAVRSAEVSFGDGLNVLHGPNDLGKSTLASAIRAALLLQHGSSGARPFVPWGSSRKPTVTLTLEIDGRHWRVHKAFGSSSGGKSLLEWSNDGRSWALEEEGRGVDGRLRELLKWGLAEPGGRGGAHGFPKSFLATVLLGEQALPYRLLETSLEGDVEDSGKARLIEALQAMATDPVYQEVLLEAQRRVDQAFTSKGKRSTRKGSPFERVTAEIKQRREASEQWVAQVAESDAVVSRLGDLAVRRDRMLAERSEAARAVERIEQALAHASARAKLQAEADAAREALAEIQRNQAAIAKLQAELSAAKDAVPNAETQVGAAAEAALAAHRELERAQSVMAALERGEDPQQREAAMARAEAKREIDAESAQLQARETTLQAWYEAARELAQAEAERAAAQQAAAGATAAREEAQTRAATATERHRTLTDALRWAEVVRLEQRVAVLAERERAARAAQAEAAAKRDAAATLEAALRTDFPDAASQAAIEQAWNTLQRCEAALRGGFRVALALSADAEAAIDGHPSEDVAGDAMIDAEREVVLSLPSLGTVTVRPGDPAAHAALDVARGAWVEHAATLERLGLTTVEALGVTARKREAQAQQRAALLRDAEVLEAKATPPDEEEFGALRAALQTARSALEGVDAAVCRAEAQARGEGLDAAVAQAEGEASRAQAAVTLEDRAVGEAQTQLRLAEQQVAAATKAEQAVRLDAADPKAAAEALEAARGAVEARRAALQEAERAELEAATLRGSQAEVALRQAEAALTAATAHEAEARKTLETARATWSSSEAALEIRREQATHQDPLSAAERVAQAQDALAAHPAPTEDISEAAVRAARDTLAQAEEALEDAERAVRQQEGALQQVGGQVVRERAQMAREALEEAERQEVEVELDYQGWRLLLETLREVENETGAHLGRALDQELAGRLEALSQGRYQGAQLGADLETEGVVTTQGVQLLERFSEGVKEQIATLLRVSVAEHLGTMLVLDDHLAQTDPARAQWFSKLLRESARGIQVVVLTCRPADYLGDGLGDSGEGVHVVDLASKVVRA